MIYESAEFWAMTTTILVLLGLVGFFYRKATKAEESAAMIIVGGIKKSVDNLAESIREHTADNSRAFEKGEKRMTKIESRLDIVETKCDMHHGTGADGS